MKKVIRLIIIGILSIIITLPSFSGTMNSVRLRSGALTIGFKGGIDAKPKVEYDKINRLLYIEFPKTDIANKITAPRADGRYVENIDIMDNGTSVGIFITLGKNISYSANQRGSNYTVTFGSKKQYTIAIDAGHGGHDPGAQSRTKQYQEKHLALAVAKYLKQELQGDFNIIMTRETDVFIPLSQRPAMANGGGRRLKADFFISVHINASTNRKATGTDVFFFSTEKVSAYAQKIAAFENSFADDNKGGDTIKQIMGDLAYRKSQEQSIKLAGPVCTAIARSLGLTDKGIHGANFAVLRGFDGPGVLLELGFISNDSDVKILTNSGKQRAAAKAVASEVRKYFYSR
ncbi:N-acetylmuramoyl-L-alanine amidase family protein [Fusobacterium sp. PH5-44]|uniref:N-acetylmuramoyl-L-alanine amidase family protein n=1 Tax=unclassified Fusobacterium TaxID=2648384 RepID=UPI003D1A8A40